MMPNLGQRSEVDVMSRGCQITVKTGEVWLANLDPTVGSEILEPA